MICILNIHWRYFLINKVCQSFYQVGHVTFSENVFWPANFALSFCQFCCIQNSALNVDISTKGCTNFKKFQEKSCDHIHDIICDPNYHRGILNVSAKIFHNSMYKIVVKSCVCANASDFKCENV